MKCRVMLVHTAIMSETARDEMNTAVAVFLRDFLHITASPRQFPTVDMSTSTGPRTRNRYFWALQEVNSHGHSVNLMISLVSSMVVVFGNGVGLRVTMMPVKAMPPTVARELTSISQWYRVSLLSFECLSCLLFAL